MHSYDLALVFSPEFESEAREKLVTKIKKVLADLDGKVEKEDEWGKRELAYPIKKSQEGFFLLWEISLPPQAVNEFDQKVKLEEGILRHLLVRTEAKSQPAAEAKTKVTVESKEKKEVKKEKSRPKKGKTRK